MSYRDPCAAKKYLSEHYQANKGYYAEKRDRQKHRNQQFLWDYLKEHPCVACGERDPLVLDFDHVRGQKDRHLSGAAKRGWSIPRLLREIEKCEVRCANCHRRRTAREGEWYKHITQ